MLQQMNKMYGASARFDINRGMSEDEIKQLAPSVFATTAHESRSDRFRPIATIEILRALRKEGFEVVGARQSPARAAGKENYTKHLLRMRRLGEQKLYQVGDTVAEMLLQNANDGSSKYLLDAGLFRIRCLNSLVACMSNIDAVSIRHSGKNVVDQVIEGTYSVIENARLALVAPQEWSDIKLDQDWQNALAEGALVARYDDYVDNIDEDTGKITWHKTPPIQPEQLLDRQRREDTNNDLWTAFNVVQENAMRGGLQGVAVNANGVACKRKTRPINGIDQGNHINRALWAVAQYIAKKNGWKEPERN